MVALVENAVAPAVRRRTSRTGEDAGRTFRPDVEGLRAVAVALVVLYHVGVRGLTGGYVGVDVFFVISGYLITGLLLAEHARTGRISFTGFYARRARRILPLASLVLVATIGAVAVLLTSSRLAAVAHDGTWSSIFAANVHFASQGADYLNATAPPSPLQHYWSLAVEEQFYLLWPALLVVALRVFRADGAGRAWRVAPFTALLVGGSLWWSIHETAQDANAAYFSAFTRAWELGAGALLAVGAAVLLRLPRAVAALLGWSGLAAIGVAAVAYSPATPFPGSAALLPVLGAVAVIAGGARAGRLGPQVVLARSPMRRLGRYSYALYLWHWPLLVVAEQRYPGLGVGPKLMLAAVALVLSAAGYRWYENPLRHARRLTRSATASLAVGLACVLATLAYAQMVVVGQRAVVARAEVLYAAQQKAARGTNTVIQLATPAAVHAAVAAAATLTTVPSTVQPPLAIAGRDVPDAYGDGCLVGTAPTSSPPCVSGDPSGTRTVVLLGDSHAVQWLPALDALAARRDLRVVTLAKHSCPVADVHTYDGIVGRYYHECVSWRRSAYLRIAALRPDTVIATETLEALVDSSGRRVPGNELKWQLGLRKSLAALTGVARHVYFLADTPRHAESAPECLARGDAAGCATPRALALDAAHESQDRASAEVAGATFVPTADWFCTASRCPSLIAGRVVDADDNHLTATYATYLSHVLGLATGLETAAQHSQTLGGVSGAEIEAEVAAAISGRPSISTITPPIALAPNDYSPAYRDGCLVDAPHTTSPDCTFGDPAAAKKVVLLGDSHAAQWMPALLDVEGRHPFALTVLTKGNCPASIMSVYSVELRRPFRECDTWRTNALQRIAQLRPQLVVVSSSFHGQRLATGGPMQSDAVERAWEEGLNRLVLQLRAIGARVAVLSDVAVHAQSVPACLEAHPNDQIACATPTVNAILVPHQLTEQKVAQASGATYVDVRPWLCTRTGCPAVVNGIVTDFDDSHLTATYSRYLGHALGLALRLE